MSLNVENALCGVPAAEEGSPTSLLAWTEPHVALDVYTTGR